jgi:hypothetical protein
MPGHTLVPPMHVECPRNREEENDAIVPKLPENVHGRKMTTRNKSSY